MCIRDRSCTDRQERRTLWEALSCRALRPGSISTTGSGSSAVVTRTAPRASPSECAASVDMTRVLMPARAAWTAVAAAVVVLPTPPVSYTHLRAHETVLD